MTDSRLNISFKSYLITFNNLTFGTMTNWLANRLKSFREQYNQTPEGIAILLNISPEDYLSLEAGVIPDDALIRLICQLFEWNYNEVTQNIRKKSAASASNKQPDTAGRVKMPNDFSKLVQTSREKVGQTVEGMALLLNIDANAYIALEKGEAPNDNLLKKLCQVFEWNYSDIKQLLLKASNARFLAEKNKAGLKLESLNQLPKAMEGLSFGEILLQARLKQGATLESLALLLNISEEELAEYESGEIPGEDMLKKICSLFEWNYKEILAHLRNRGFSSFPADRKEKPKTNIRVAGIQELCGSIQNESTGLADSGLKVIEIQLKLIQRTIRELKSSV